MINEKISINIGLSISPVCSPNKFALISTTSQKQGSHAESNLVQRFLRSREKDLVPTLELIKTAVLNGELDTQIEAAANKLRDGFAQ